MTETWKSIPGWSAYEVSDYGQVRSLPVGHHWGRILKPQVKKVGKRRYHAIELNQDGRIGRQYISRYVLLTFRPVDNAHELQAAHNDGDGTNNHLANLRWATPKENTADRKLHGTASYGNKYAAHINIVIVRIIRRLLERGVINQRRIAKTFQVSPALITLIKQGACWA